MTMLTMPQADAILIAELEERNRALRRRNNAVREVQKALGNKPRGPRASDTDLPWDWDIYNLLGNLFTEGGGSTFAGIGPNITPGGNPADPITNRNPPPPGGGG